MSKVISLLEPLSNKYGTIATHWRMRGTRPVPEDVLALWCWLKLKQDRLLHLHTIAGWAVWSLSSRVQINSCLACKTGPIAGWAVWSLCSWVQINSCLACKTGPIADWAVWSLCSQVQINSCLACKTGPIAGWAVWSLCSQVQINSCLPCKMGPIADWAVCSFWSVGYRINSRTLP